MNARSKACAICAVAIIVVAAAYVVASSLAGTYALFSDSERVPVSIAAALDFGPAPASIAATVDIDPNTLNPGSEGNFVMAYIELPEGWDVADIDVSTVTLEIEGAYGSVPTELSPTEVADHDGDTISDLMVKFGRAAVLALLGSVGEHATVVVAGELSSGERFEGSDVVRLLDPPTATPTPDQTATPAPIAAVTPTPSPIPIATASATPVPTPVPTASPTPSATPVPAPGGIYVSVTCQGQPVAEAQVTVSHQSPGEPVVWSGGTGDDGELSTGLVLKAGSYLVDIVKQGASYDSVIAAVPAGGYAPVYAQCTALWGTGYPDW